MSSTLGPGGHQTPPPRPDESFPEVGIAADEAAKDSALDKHNPDDPAIPAKTDTEAYRNQVELDMEAYRKLRWWAAIFVGILTLIFFLLLIGAFRHIFFGNYLIELIEAASAGGQWHALLFLGIVLAIFSATPLSLGLAVIKMISGKSQDGSTEVKIPAIELARAIAELGRGTNNAR